LQQRELQAAEELKKQAKKVENANERVQQFIANQIEFEQARFEKLAEIMMHEEEQGFFKPAINQNSKKILEKKKQQDEERPSVRRAAEIYEPNFQPEINKKSKDIKRAAPIEILLTEDAKRRESKLLESSNNRILEETNTPKVKPVDSVSQDLIFARYERDLGQVLEHLEFTNKTALLNMEQSLEVFIQMGFVQPENKLDLESFNHLWTLMSKQDSTMQANINTYMCAVQNMNFAWMQTPSHEGQATLTAKEIRDISTFYLRLNQNRKDFVMRTKAEYYNN
jgi:hypothetical protein